MPEDDFLKLGDKPSDNLAEEMLNGLPLATLRDMEYEAEMEFRRSKTPQEMIERTLIWRLIETVYLKRLSRGKAND
jgi:hypothetical protein